MAQVKLTLEMENFRQERAAATVRGARFVRLLLPSRKLGIVCNGLEDQIMVKMAKMHTGLDPKPRVRSLYNVHYKLY